MFSIKLRFIITIFAVFALSVSNFVVAAEMSSQPCETCSMTVAADAQAHIKVVDSSGATHYVECLKCAFKVLKNTPEITEITITTNCDWNGPNYPITINLKKYVNTTTVNPSTALLIDGGCTKNRVVYDQVAANALLTNGGISPYLTVIQNVTVPSNATVMSFAEAAIKYAYVTSPDTTPTPTPTPSPPATSSPTTPASTAKPTIVPTPTKTPTVTPAPTLAAIQDCEACGMEVNTDAQTKYRVVDGNGVVHYAECFMCALNLINDYDSLTISTYCDWYGPDYPVTIQSKQKGQEVTVDPSTAVFLDGGSCVINRAAYNQTAADQLLTNGFSKFTLPEQHYDLPASTKASLVSDAAMLLSKNDADQNPTNLIIFGAFGGLAIIAVSIVAYKKLKFKQD